MAKKTQKDTSRTSKLKADPNSLMEEINIPEDEQWRLIKESGVLEKLRPSEVAGSSNKALISREETSEEMLSLGEEIFSAIIMIVPFTFLLLMMEM